MQVYQFGFVAPKSVFESLDLEKLESAVKGCTPKKGGLDSGYGLNLKQNVNGLTPLKYYFACGKRYFYSADNHLYLLNDTAIEKACMQKFNSAPKVIELNFFGKDFAYALSDNHLYSLSNTGETLSTVSCEFCGTLSGVFYAVKGNRISLAPAELVFEKGYRAENFNELNFSRNDGKIKAVFESEKGLKILTETCLYEFSFDMGLKNAVLKKERVFSEKVLGVAIINGAIFCICKTKLITLNNNSATELSLPYKITEIESVAQSNGVILASGKQETKEFILAFSQDKKAVQFIWANGVSLASNGEVLLTSENSIYSVGESQTGYYETKKVRFIKGKDKSHLIAVYFNSKGKGRLIIEGDFGSKEYSINSGDNHIRTNIFSKYFTFKFYLENTPKLSDFIAEYTE